MSARYGTGGFGTNLADCPVPAGADGKGKIVYTKEEHDTWCDCVFAGFPEYAARCKQKIDLLKPDTWKFGLMPWTPCGSGVRGIPHPQQVVASACDGAIAVAEELAQEAVDAAMRGGGGGGGGGGTNQIVLDNQPTHPATPIVTPNAGTPNRNQRLSREEMMALTMTAAADKGTATMQQYVAPRNPRLDVGPRLTIRPTQQTPPPPLPEEPKSNLLMWGALAVGAVLILRRPRRSVSGFGGYGGRRRRSRR